VLIFGEIPESAIVLRKDFSDSKWISEKEIFSIIRRQDDRALLAILSGENTSLSISKSEVLDSDRLKTSSSVSLKKSQPSLSDSGNFETKNSLTSKKALSRKSDSTVSSKLTMAKPTTSSKLSSSSSNSSTIPELKSSSSTSKPKNPPQLPSKAQLKRKRDFVPPVISRVFLFSFFDSYLINGCPLGSI
jgi:hypothetical protein